MNNNIQKLLDAVQELLDSADSTGCTDDLTVVSQTALDKVESLYLSVSMTTPRE